MELNLTNVIAERKTKTVYLDSDKIVKLFVENYSKADILNEALNQARVEEGTDLNIPRLIEVTKVNNRWAIVIEYVEGETLAELMEKNPSKIDEYLNMLVDVQLEVLSKNVPMLSMLKDKYKRKLTNLDIDENTRYELTHRLEGMKNHTKLCHGDMNPTNIIISKDGAFHIVDWAHATQGNASADCAMTYVLFMLEGKNELAEKYMNIFATKSEIEIGNIQRWIPIVSAIKLEKANDKEKEMLKQWITVMDYE